MPPASAQGCSWPEDDLTGENVKWADRVARNLAGLLVTLLVTRSGNFGLFGITPEDCENTLPAAYPDNYNMG
jgi:hypothetical protein